MELLAELEADDDGWVLDELELELGLELLQAAMATVAVPMAAAAMKRFREASMDISVLMINQALAT